MIEFFKEMTVGNRWLWFHILAGGFVAKVIYLIPIDWNPVVWHKSEILIYWILVLIIAVIPHEYILHKLF